MAFADSFVVAYHFRLLYLSSQCIYPIMGALRRVYGQDWEVRFCSGLLSVELSLGINRVPTRTRHETCQNLMEQVFVLPLSWMVNFKFLHCLTAYE